MPCVCGKFRFIGEFTSLQFASADANFAARTLQNQFNPIFPATCAAEKSLLTENRIFLSQSLIAPKILFAVQPFQMKSVSRISFGERSDKLQFV